MRTGTGGNGGAATAGVELIGVEKSYRTSRGVVPAVRGIDVSVAVLDAPAADHPAVGRAYLRAKVLTGYAMALLTIASLYASGAILGVRLPAERWLERTGLILVACCRSPRSGSSSATC